MAPPLLHLRDIHLGFGGPVLLAGAELAVGPGERVCLVGRNGSGKSTLLKIAAGLIDPDQGERFVQPGATVRYLPQEPDLSGHGTVLEYVNAGLGPGDDPHRARMLLEHLGLTGDEDPSVLSGGEARRAALARTLAPQPDILLLDEPTNHLDLPAIEWLERELAGTSSALVLISHDRRFLEKLSRATVWIDRGTARRLDQGFGAFEAWRDRVFEEEETAAHKLDRKIVAEQDWLRYGVTARRKRNQRRLADLHDMRRQRRESRGPVGTVTLNAAQAESSGRLVVDAEDVCKGYGGPDVVSGFTTRILRGDRVGIVGPNGAGKSTLLGLLTGTLAPDAGTVKLGSNLQMVTLDQHRESLAPTLTLKDALTGSKGDTVQVGGQSRHVIGYMKDFLFGPEQAGTPLSKLSGGERARVMLARALATPSNLMVLDEPTNDLDLETLDLLEEMLADYAGTLIMVSHDRDFLDRVVTSVIVSEGQGRWQEYPGGYSDMLAQRKAAVPERAINGGQANGAQGSGKGGGKAGGSAGGATGGERAAPKKKLSFKDKHALDTLPARMEALQGDMAALEAKMAAPDFYAKDPQGFEKTATALEAAQKQLADAEEQWLELEMLREELEG